MGRGRDLGLLGSFDQAARRRGSIAWADCVSGPFARTSLSLLKDVYPGSDQTDGALAGEHYLHQRAGKFDSHYTARVQLAGGSGKVTVGAGGNSALMAMWHSTPTLPRP